MFFFRQVRNRNIVQFFGLYESKGQQYMVCEFMRRGKENSWKILIGRMSIGFVETRKH